jgi:hypothetical protein
MLGALLLVKRGRGRLRRVSLVRVFAGEGLLAEPIEGPQLQWRELVIMPLSRHFRAQPIG